MGDLLPRVNKKEWGQATMPNCHFCKKPLDPSLKNINQDGGWVLLEYRRPLVSDFHPTCLYHAGVKETIASESPEGLEPALLKRRKAEIWKNASWAERNVISEEEKSQIGVR
jgi:hypothetical protein